MSRRAWWIVLGIPVLLVVGLVLGSLGYAALQDDAPAAETVRAQPEGLDLSAPTDGTWTVAGGSSAGYRVDEVLNGADVTVAGTTDEVTGSVVVEDAVLTGTPVTVPVTGELSVAGEPREVQVDLSVVRTAEGVDVSGSVPVTFADHGIEPPDLGFVSVEDQGAIEFLLHLAL